MDDLTRDGRRGARRGRPAGRLPRALRDRRRAPDLPRRQLARAHAAGDPLPAGGGGRRVGRAPRHRAGTTWIDAPRRAGDVLAGLLGARPGEVIVCDSTTVNLYKLCSAALDARAHATLATDRDNFPTDRYVLEGLAAQRGCALEILDEPEVLPDALVVRSHVGYRSGALADMRAVTDEARAAGSTMIWDLCHSAGAVPIDLRGAGVELAVGCTYKYLNAGPGAPAFLYVAEELQERLRSPIWGWFGQRDQFAMERDYDPVDGIERFLAGTPTILAVAAVEEGARAHGRGRHRRPARQVDRADRAGDRAARRVARAARVRARQPARGRAPRLARRAAPPGRLADQPRADRARRRDPRLPRAGHDPARHRPALHALRRRLGRARPPARSGGARRAPRGGRRARPRHLTPCAGCPPMLRGALGRAGRALTPSASCAAPRRGCPAAAGMRRAWRCR